MEKVLALLLQGVFCIVCIFLSGVSISLSVRAFKQKKYFLFGTSLTTALLYAMLLAELVFAV